jgi:hypothetical protein
MNIGKRVPDCPTHLSSVKSRTALPLAAKKRQHSRIPASPFGPQRLLLLLPPPLPPPPSRAEGEVSGKGQGACAPALRVGSRGGRER